MKNIKIILDKEKLYELYVEKNLSQVECANFFGTTPNIVKKRLREFDIKKPQDKFKEIHVKKSNQTEESKKTREKTCLKKYGVTNVSKLKSVKDKKEQTTQKSYGVINPFMSEEIKDKISKEIQTKYGVPYACMRKECRKYSGNDSVPNKAFAELLQKNNIEFEREFPLKNYSYDFKVGKYLFEINPTIFHNSTFAPVGNPKDKNYHQVKSIVANENGFRCIHIFDWDDTEKIVKLFLTNKEHIYARNCIVKEVNRSEAVRFISEYHLQGYAKDSIRVGLYQKDTDELVSIMTFDKPRYNKNYEYEIVRYCTKKIVVGGANKLFKYFLETYEPKNMISYCDLSKFDGETYHNLGFKLKEKPKPSCHWVNLKTGQHITDNFLRKNGFDHLFKTNYGKGTSNEELMLQHDFVKIYDVGQATYVLTKTS